MANGFNRQGKRGAKSTSRVGRSPSRGRAGRGSTTSGRGFTTDRRDAPPGRTQNGAPRGGREFGSSRRRTGSLLENSASRRGNAQGLSHSSKESSRNVNRDRSTQVSQLPIQVSRSLAMSEEVATTTVSATNGYVLCDSTVTGKRPASSPGGGEDSSDTMSKIPKVLWSSGKRSRGAMIRGIGGGGSNDGDGDGGAGSPKSDSSSRLGNLMGEGISTLVDGFQECYGEAIDTNSAPPVRKKRSATPSTSVNAAASMTKVGESRRANGGEKAVELATSMSAASPEVLRARARAREEHPKRQVQSAIAKKSVSCLDLTAGGSKMPSFSGTNGSNDSAIGSNGGCIASADAAGGVVPAVTVTVTPSKPTQSSSTTIQAKEHQAADPTSIQLEFGPAKNEVGPHGSVVGKGSASVSVAGRSGAAHITNGSTRPTPPLDREKLPTNLNVPLPTQNLRLQMESGEQVQILPATHVAEAAQPIVRYMEGGVEECKGFDPPNLPVASHSLRTANRAEASMETPEVVTGVSKALNAVRTSVSPPKSKADPVPTAEPKTSSSCPPPPQRTSSWGASFGIQIPDATSCRSTPSGGKTVASHLTPSNPWYLSNGAPDFAKNKFVSISIPNKTLTPPLAPVSLLSPAVASVDRSEAGVGKLNANRCVVPPPIQPSWSPPLDEEVIARAYEELSQTCAGQVGQGMRTDCSGAGSRGSSKERSGTKNVGFSEGDTEGPVGSLTVAGATNDTDGKTVKIITESRKVGRTKGILEMLEKERRAAAAFEKKLTKALLDS
ncbi:unnamed protein product [Choristocarpus tenellus]